MSTKDIISDEQISHVHGYANFGSMDKREVVDEGVLKTALKFPCGGTQMAILKEHGLAKSSVKGGYDIYLTPKGRKYLEAAFGSDNYAEYRSLEFDERVQKYKSIIKEHKNDEQSCEP